MSEIIIIPVIIFPAAPPFSMYVADAVVII